MVVAVAGVTATNIAPAYSTVGFKSESVRSGISDADRNPSRDAQRISIRIDTSGQTGALVYSYSVDGAAYVTGQTVVNADESRRHHLGLGFTLANGAGKSLVHRWDRLYGFSCQGTWITAQGTDAEYDPALATRDKKTSGHRWRIVQTAIPGSLHARAS